MLLLGRLFSQSRRYRALFGPHPNQSRDSQNQSFQSTY